MEREILARFPGISCAYADASGQVRTACFGFADRETGVPVNADVLFPACSISKFVTALCLMKLHEAHILDIDAPANACLRTWKLRTQEGRESDAAVRAIMCHTAGVTDGEDAFYGLRQGGPEITLMDILEGRTAYNDRPAQAGKVPGDAFAYSDAGYCVLQLLVEQATGKPFADAAQELIFAPLGLRSTFFATPESIAAHHARMATGYDGDDAPLPGRFPPCPDLAASGLWTTPEELVMLGRAFVSALHGEGSLLQPASAREMASPVPSFPWTGLGLFISSEDILMSQGWGEHGQCMMKMNRRTRTVAAVMTNRNPEADQAESGVERLVDSLLTQAE